MGVGLCLSRLSDEGCIPEPMRGTLALEERGGSQIIDNVLPSSPSQGSYGLHDVKIISTSKEGFIQLLLN
jgi:hypothetical protein